MFNRRVKTLDATLPSWRRMQDRCETNRTGVVQRILDLQRIRPGCGSGTIPAGSESLPSCRFVCFCATRWSRRRSLSCCFCLRICSLRRFSIGALWRSEETTHAQAVSCGLPNLSGTKGAPAPGLSSPTSDRARGCCRYDCRHHGCHHHRSRLRGAWLHSP